MRKIQLYSSSFYKKVGFMFRRDHLWLLITFCIGVWAAPGLGACGEDNGGELEEENLSPTVSITQPENTWEYMEGEEVEFTCEALDEEEGVIGGESITWESDLDGLLGNGASILINDLSLGAHTITVTAVDSEGAYGSAQAIVQVQDPLEVLLEWMSGSFSSEEQASVSDDPYHVDVRLFMARIWHQKEGYWLYVEQAYADSLHDPYRQRIYKVFAEGGVLADEIYSMPNDTDYVGSWQTPGDFDGLEPDDLTLRENCGLVFEWRRESEGHFYGTTSGQDCTASIPGVSYLTSESEIYESFLTSWDLGYDSNDNIVMGPYSPYVFDKVENLPFF